VAGSEGSARTLDYLAKIDSLTLNSRVHTAVVGNRRERLFTIIGVSLVGSDEIGNVGFKSSGRCGVVVAFIPIEETAETTDGVSESRVNGDVEAGVVIEEDVESMTDDEGKLGAVTKNTDISVPVVVSVHDETVEGDFVGSTFEEDLGGTGPDSDLLPTHGTSSITRMFGDVNGQLDRFRLVQWLNKGIFTVSAESVVLPIERMDVAVSENDAGCCALGGFAVPFTLVTRALAAWLLDDLSRIVGLTLVVAFALALWDTSAVIPVEPRSTFTSRRAVIVARFILSPIFHAARWTASASAFREHLVGWA